MDSQIKRFAKTTELGGGNADFVEALFEQWLSDPESVGASWQRRFAALPHAEATERPHSAVRERMRAIAKLGPQANGAAGEVEDGGRQGAVLKLITAYRSRGHLRADLDPLGLYDWPDAPDLELEFHGLAQSDLDRTFVTGTLPGPPRQKLATILERLQRIYSASIGAEFMHITVAEERRWLYERLEARDGQWLGKDADRQQILERLTAAEGLERYLHTKYVGQKRFSLEGGDSLIPLLDELVQRAAADGVREMVIGMAHRGRLNVLVNVLGKPPEQLFGEFEGRHDGPVDPAHSGDVKYHMGYSADIAIGEDASIHLALGFNPSHLEIIDPVVAGSVRARQMRRGDGERAQVIPLLLHGDAAFAAQGVVMELLQMSQARGFAVGGTMHVVINNQIGFTTSHAEDARSTLYCTDVAKMVGAPVLHVNGDDPEAVVYCAQLAYDFRQQFHKDVVIDLVCYRRHGHNEADEPAATQPVMYQAIRQHPTTRELYARQLEQRSLLDSKAAAAMVDKFRERLEAGGPVVDLAKPARDAFSVDWSPWLDGDIDSAIETGVDMDALIELASQLFRERDDIVLHNRVAKIMEERRRMTAGETPLDWGYAENLAYATLLAQGYRLRLTGQDSGRGTFFHRHAVLHGQKADEIIIPLREFAEDPQHAMVIDSLLSEEAVLGFEYGYATAEPQTLVIWEAQFGDFVNGAQVVIDQFISSGEAKWGRLCGLALMLPHGYEGQGPEHSSARLERFLQLCALNNMQVCAPTTPAQMFHLLRRQMLMATRKPLIIMSPKSMLRLKDAFSSLGDLAKGHFQTLIGDSLVPATVKARRVVLCSGKVYYDLAAEAQKRELSDCAIVRIEQLYPFPREALLEELDRHQAAKTIVWCQEEPMNQGAWYQIQHHLRDCLGKGQILQYSGRARSPSPAAGHFATHVAEQAALVEAALTGTASHQPATD